VTLQERLGLVSGRGPGFDQIRLVAATVVLLHHCRLTQNDIRDPLFLYSGGFVHFGLLAVIVFFAISGFLVTPSLLRSGDLVEFSINRVLRIFPALAVVVLAIMVGLGPLLTSVSYREYFTDPLFYRYAKNILTLTSNYLPGVTSAGGVPLVVNGALWTLHFEVLAYGTLALMSVLGILRSRAILAITILSSFVVYLSIHFDPGFARWLPGRFVTFMELFIYFAAGSALFVIRDRIPFSGALALFALLAILVSLPIGLGPVFLPICLPYIAVFGGLSVLPGKSLLKRDISYGVYLIHASVVVAFTLLFPGIGHWWLLAVLVFVATLILAYLSRILVEEPALARKKALSHWINSRVGTLKPRLTFDS
jgi:peptidoglycan/LPS O-acetylase OafA/YrhL